ncbi:armadillo-type protein [Schizophyllum amplum]|uniref:Armadillo-type protein n=1 Tax=Schizophyllum amplum TaxID=97359 RepID=A0A550CID2_9AGAR|nr:armadillo-type protein [Auriculariopsis ampla]
MDVPEVNVPAEVTSEMTQILSNLVLGDNDIRSSAEKAVNERLEHMPEQYLLALAQFAVGADSEVMRSFSLVLLRRFLFKRQFSTTQNRLALYDQLSAQTLSTLERALLRALTQEPDRVVRRKLADTVSDVANQAMRRGRPWHALQALSFSMTGEGGDTSVSQSPAHRESAYAIFAGCPNLVLDLQTDAVLRVFLYGLRYEDQEAAAVRQAALSAAVAYLSHCESAQRSQSLSLIPAMLDVLPRLLHSHFPAAGPNTSSSTEYLTQALETLTPLATSFPSLFAPHVPALLSMMPQLVLPPVDSGPTPTVTQPFQPFAQDQAPRSPSQSPTPNGDEEDAEERRKLRSAALEFMLSLTEAKPSMFKPPENSVMATSSGYQPQNDAWVPVLVRACLEGMAELSDDDTEPWLQEDPSAASTEDDNAQVYEQSLDRLACAIGGHAVLPVAFQQIPSLLASYDWRSRHAGLMAIAAIAEGTGEIMQNELARIVGLVTPLFSDSHPRVRYAACQCIGQLCTDLEEIIQEQHPQELIGALVPALEDSEPRVHAHAAAALINFCEGVARDTLVPFLDPIVERLLRLLKNNNVKKYVQEQAITTLAMVADASEGSFAKYYSTIMPLLLRVLSEVQGPEYNTLRAKTMECAGLIAIAVGRDTFIPDATNFCEQLIRIQKSPEDMRDPQIPHYLTATWAKVCQAMGQDFEPYLPVVMPPLLATASAKAEVAVYDEEESEREGWETITMGGEVLGIRTSEVEDKCQALEMLVIYCSTLGPKFAPYMAPTLEVALPCLRFYFHDGVREACAMLIPMLLACGKNTGTLTPAMAGAALAQVIGCLGTEADPSFLGSLYRCCADSLMVVGAQGGYNPGDNASTGLRAAVGEEMYNAVMDATKRQLHAMAERRRGRTARAQAMASGGSMFDADERDDMALMEEIEEFCLEDMAKLIAMFDKDHPLLIAVSSVKDLGFGAWTGDEGEEIG